jgi:hypothetical protein
MKHTLYGVKGAAVAQVGQAVSSALSVELAERESDYLGVYLNGKVGSTKIRVVAQPDPEGEPLEKEFAEWNVLVYLDGSDDLPSLNGLKSGNGVIHILRE